MNKSELLINDRIDVFYRNEYYKSNIQDITEKYIAISIPARDGKYAILDKNDEFDIIYYKEGCAYHFKSVVIARKKEVIPIVLIKLPEDINQIQRRMFVRIDLLLEFKYFNINNSSDLSDEQIIKRIVNKKVKLSKGILLDLSAGGIKISINEKIEYGDIIFAGLNFIDSNLIIKSRAVRVNKSDREANQYICGFEFIDIEETDRDKIMKYLFEVMRKQRRIRI